MPIKISKPAPAPELSPHGEAAGALAMTTTEVTPPADAPDPTKTTETKAHDTSDAPSADPMSSAHPAYVTVGSAFRMPVAAYTMLEFQVRITLPCLPEEADEAFDAAKAWVEARLNSMIEEQTSETQE